MAEKFVQCPKDPKMMYLKEICENVFRKNGFRTWCQKCQNFLKAEPQSKSA